MKEVQHNLPPSATEDGPVLDDQGREALEANLHKERERFKGEVAANNQADAAALGEIAAGHEVHTDASGVVMTDHEVQSELAYRAANGRPSDDSHTEV